MSLNNYPHYIKNKDDFKNDVQYEQTSPKIMHMLQTAPEFPIFSKLNHFENILLI